MTLAAGLILAAGTASARTKHHHHHASMTPAAAAYTPTRSRDSFYPYEIEGGSPGNLPFNNQIRKLSDPLNANGGK